VRGVFVKQSSQTSPSVHACLYCSLLDTKRSQLLSTFQWFSSDLKYPIMGEQFDIVGQSYGVALPYLMVLLNYSCIPWGCPCFLDLLVNLPNCFLKQANSRTTWLKPFSCNLNKISSGPACSKHRVCEQEVHLLRGLTKAIEVNHMCREN